MAINSSVIETLIPGFEMAATGGYFAIHYEGGNPAASVVRSLDGTELTRFKGLCRDKAKVDGLSFLQRNFGIVPFILDIPVKMVDETCFGITTDLGRIKSLGANAV